MIEYVDAKKCYMTLCLNVAPISSRVRFFKINIKWYILKRKDDELILKVFNAQSESPLPGDFVLLCEKDFELINEKFDKSLITSMSKKEFKKSHTWGYRCRI